MAAFDEASSLAPLERARCLDARGLTPSERVDVEAMLSKAARNDPRLDAGVGLRVFAERAPIFGEGRAHEAVGVIPILTGHYRILRVLGEGGMGIVYEAEQTIPRRRVALKAVRAGQASRQMLRRFEREAHILGRLHHLGIAQIYEAGANDAERGDEAFIAMELVDGPQLTTWARERPLREKIELMVKVCDAVQHAHQRRVIHRDLKPANILVDASAQPKVLDFGVARMADVEAEIVANATVAGQIVGTLAYMSPEQVDGDPDEIDARTDVYALGAILYELLAGRQPLEIGSRTIPQICVAIGREVPKRLSTFDRALAGDLETIAATALEKDKERRYPSAAELGAELQRWLAGAPIAARQSSGLYVLKKQIQRHRFVVLAGAIVVSAIVATAIWALFNARRAETSAIDLARALRASNIERGRLMGLSDNLEGAEELIWSAARERDDPHTHWALWELYSRYPCVRTFRGHADSVLAMATSPDGSTIATSSHDESMRLWNWRTGESLGVFSGDEPLAQRLAFAEKGASVCFASTTGILRCWDVAARRERWNRAEFAQLEMWALACDPRGALGAIAGKSARIDVFDVENGATRSALTGAEHGTRALCFQHTHPKLAAGGDDGIVRIFDLDTRSESERLVGGPTSIAVLAFDHSDARIAVGDVEGDVTLWDVATRSRLATFESDLGPVRVLDFDAADEKLLVSATLGIEVWDLATNTRAGAPAELRQHSFAARFAPDDGLLLTGSGNGAIRVWELEARAFHRKLDWKLASTSSLAFTPAQPIVARADEDGSIEIYDVRDGSLTTRVPASLDTLVTASFDPTGEHVFALDARGKLCGWNWRTNVSTFEMDLGAPANSVRFSPDRTLIACVLDMQQIALFDTRTKSRLRTFEPADVLCERLSFSSDGQRIASTHHGRKIRVWNAATGALLSELSSQGALRSVAFIGPRDRLVVGAWDGRLEVWDVERGVRERTLEGHAQRVNQIVARKDGSLFATASSDGAIRLWDLDTDFCLSTLDARAGVVHAVAFSSDETSLRSFHGDGSLHEWDLSYYDRHIAGNAAFQSAPR